MWSAERKGHVSATMKATHGRNDVGPQREALSSRTHSYFLSTDRIRVLCTMALAAKIDTALNVVLPQLQAAIAEHTKHIREMAAKQIPRAFRPESNAAD